VLDGCCDPCCRPSRGWVGAEFLGWWVSNDPTPPLAVYSFANVNGVPGSGIPGAADTVVVAGGENGVLSQNRPGFRVYGGWWLSDCQNWGIDGSFFILPQKSGTSAFGPVDGFYLARPYAAVVAPAPGVDGLILSPSGGDVVAFPGQSVGNIAISSHSELYGADVNLRKNILCGCNWRWDFLGGFRYLNLNENITITESTFVTGPFPATKGGVTASLQGLAGQAFDSFETRNRFYGGQLGFAGELRRGRWVFTGRTLFGIGTTHQEVTVNGGTTFVVPPTIPTPPFPASGIYPSGLLAVSGANIGTFSQNRFSFVPEVGLNVGYMVRPNLKVFLGYNFLYWSSVVRPGDQINTTVNEQLIANQLFRDPVTPASPTIQPTVPFKTTDFWAQGISLGLEWTW
jgi:hypothetical protein